MGKEDASKLSVKKETLRRLGGAHRRAAAPAAGGTLALSQATLPVTSHRAADPHVRGHLDHQRWRQDLGPTCRSDTSRLPVSLPLAPVKRGRADSKKARSQAGSADAAQRRGRPSATPVAPTNRLASSAAPSSLR